MKRIVLAVAMLAGLAACDKPSKEDCRKALLNMQHLMGTENITANVGIEGDVRRCEGGSRKAAVLCAQKATTREELMRCDFLRPEDLAPAQGSGSAGSGSAGSAGSGS
jgi:hypothetical protein